MKKMLRELNSFVKGVILFLRPGLYPGFLTKPLLFLANLLQLTKWISQENRKDILNDFYKPIRKYNDRVKLYEYVLEKENLEEAACVCG